MTGATTEASSPGRGCQRQHDDRRQPVVGPPQGGRAGKPQAAKRPRQCGRRKQVCGLRRAAADVNSLARLEPMNKVGELDLRQQGLLTDTYLSLMRRERPRV
jgi:hypothetical protein